MKNVAKKMGIEDLAFLMHKGFGEIHQKMATKMEIEDLAVMVQRGFEEMHDKMATKEDLRIALGQLENRLDDKIEGLGMRFGSYVSDCDANFDDLDIRVTKLEDRVTKVK